MARLELRKVKQVSRVDVSNRPIIIGRSSQCTLVLADTHVSRQHCVIEVVDGQTRIRDLESHGGTFLNGKRVTEATLTHGDRLSIGPYDLVYKDPLKPKATKPVVIEAVPLETANGSAVEVEIEPLTPPANTNQFAALEQQLGNIERQRAQDAEQLRKLSEQLQAAQKELEDLKSAQSRAERDRQTARNDLHAVQAALAEARAQAELARQEVEAKQIELDETGHAAQTLQERIDHLHAQGKKDVEQVRSELAYAQGELDRLRMHESTLEEQVETVEASRRIATERAEQSSRAMMMLQGQVGPLHDAAAQVAALQDRLAQIEIAWSEVDQQLENTDEDDGDMIEQAALARHRISQELDSLHQQRDAAVARLREAAERLRSITERPVVRVLNIAAPGARPAHARRWWRFGK